MTTQGLTERRRVAVAGASGYTGVELLRFLVQHPAVQVVAVTAETHANQPISQVFPSLNGFVDLTCLPLDPASLAREAEFVFLALPHKASMTVGAALLDRGARVLDLSAALYIMAPNSMIAILLGMAVGGLFANTLRAIVIIGLGSWLFEVTYSVVSFWQLFLVFFLTMVALYGMGMMSASVYLLLSREAWHISNLAQEPIYLASGFYFPVKNLNYYVALTASLIPLTMGLDAMRQLGFPSGAALGFLSVNVEIIVLTILSVVFLIGAKLLLDYMEKLAVREGRLTESRR